MGYPLFTYFLYNLTGLEVKTMHQKSILFKVAKNNIVV